MPHTATDTHDTLTKSFLTRPSSLLVGVQVDRMSIAEEWSIYVARLRRILQESEKFRLRFLRDFPLFANFLEFDPMPIEQTPSVNHSHSKSSGPHGCANSPNVRPDWQTYNPLWPCLSTNIRQNRKKALREGRPPSQKRCA